MKRGGRFSLWAVFGTSVVGLALISPMPAGATTIQVGSTFVNQNDCSGVFGQGFANCKIPESIDADQSPVIIKFAFAVVQELGVFVVDEINTALFPSISGEEFSFLLQDCTMPPFPGGLPGDPGACGQWTYNPAGDGNLTDDDPAAIVTYWVAKGANDFNLFTDDGGTAVTSGTWFTPVNPKNPNDPNDDGRFGLSHLTFYDTGGGPPQEMPEPGSMLLIGAALAGLGLMRRRRTRT